VDLADATKAVAKVYCVLEIRLNSMKAQNFVGQNKSLGEFIKDITGAKPPTHALTLKNSFGSFVLSGFNTEEDYDSNSNNCLELAQKIVNAVKGNLQHEAVQKAANELHTRTDKEAKNLREILATVKPAEKLTADEAKAMIEQIVEDGHLGAALAHLAHEMVSEMSESMQKATYGHVTNALETLDVALGELPDKWIKERQDAVAPVQFLAAGKPITPAPAETPTEAVAA